MIRVLIFIISLSLSSAYSHGQTFNIIGDDDYPPFTYYDKNTQVRGIDIELFKEVANRLDTEINITLVPFKRLFKITRKGDSVGSFALFKTPERESFSLFTNPIHYRPLNYLRQKKRI